MYEIRILLNHGSAADIMATQPGGGAAALPPGMMGHNGIYLIMNPGNLTYYAGISGNVGTRFNGRRQVVNELCLSAGDLAGIRMWYGDVSTRTLHVMPNFPHALPAFLTNRPLAEAYALQNGVASREFDNRAVGGGLGNVPAAMPTATLSVRNLQNAAVRWATDPIDRAAWTYRAWLATPGLGPKSWANISPQFAGLLPFPPPGGAAGFLTGVHYGAPKATARAAAEAVFAGYVNGAPLALINSVGAALDHYGGAGPAVPLTDITRTIHRHFGGPALAPPTGAPGYTPRLTAGGHANTLMHGAIDLEHVFIRYVGWYGPLPAGQWFSQNGGPQVMHMAHPHPLQPICITFRRSNGGVFPLANQSTIWWPGSML